MPRGRYAPSPTGAQHLGNARTALAAWARARSTGSTFVLRLEDLDRPRTVPAAVTGNLHELRWLGLDWDEGPDVGGPHGPYRQSCRDELYAGALARLRAQGRTFACWLSRKDLRELSSAPHGSTAVYGARERAASARAEVAKRAQGKEPAIRLRMPETTERWDDGVAGRCFVDVASAVGDLVLRRADGAWAYQLAVVVDDAAMAIEEVVRGDDLLPSAAAQRALHRLLGGDPPRYAHLPLLHGPGGERLAKRRGEHTLGALQHAGVPPDRVVGLLAWSLGQIERPEPLAAGRLAASFDLGSVPRHPVLLDDVALGWLHGGAAPSGPPAEPGRALDTPGDGR